MTERDLRKRMAAYIRQRQGWAVVIHGGPQQTKGLPDIIFGFRGRGGGFEVKLPGKENTLTKIQAQTLKNMQDAGLTARMVTTLGQVKETLDRIEEDEHRYPTFTER